MPAVLRVSPASTIQEGTLLSATIDSWPPCQFDRATKARAWSTGFDWIDLSPREQVYCLHLNALFQSLDAS